MTEDEMVGCHHQLNGHEFEYPPLADSQGICKDSLPFLISWTEFSFVKSCFHFLALGENDRMCQQSR